jgi:hypothetical protein
MSIEDELGAGDNGRNSEQEARRADRSIEPEALEMNRVHGSLPDAIWERIESDLPCDKSALITIGTDEEILELTPRQYIELRFRSLVDMLELVRADRSPSLREVRETRNDVLEKAEQFVEGMKDLYGTALRIGARGDLRKLLSKVEEFADAGRKAIAGMKIKRERKGGSSRHMILLNVLQVYRELGGELRTSYRSDIGEDGPALRFLVHMAEAVLGETLTPGAARRFIRDNRHGIGSYGQISTLRKN